MSQFKISVKKDSMRKNKKLAINIALSKEGLASRLGADHHDLGSTLLIREEKDMRSEPSQRPRRDVSQRGCSKAKEIDQATDDYSSDVRYGLVREVNVGTGLSGALKFLREQGSFKEENKLVGVTNIIMKLTDSEMDLRIYR